MRNSYIRVHTTHSYIKKNYFVYLGNGCNDFDQMLYLHKVLIFIYKNPYIFYILCFFEKTLSEVRSTNIYTPFKIYKRNILLVKSLAVHYLFMYLIQNIFNPICI